MYKSASTKMIIMSLSLLAFTGCVDSWDVVDKKKPSYIGQPIDVLIMRFGSPSASGKLAGEEYYTWTNSYEHEYASIEGSTQLNCSFIVKAKSGRITDMSVDGNNGACEAYASRL